MRQFEKKKLMWHNFFTKIIFTLNMQIIKKSTVWWKDANRTYIVLTEKLWTFTAVSMPAYRRVPSRDRTCLGRACPRWPTSILRCVPPYCRLLNRWTMSAAPMWPPCVSSTMACTWVGPLPANKAKHAGKGCRIPLCLFLFIIIQWIMFLGNKRVCTLFLNLKVFSVFIKDSKNNFSV